MAKKTTNWETAAKDRELLSKVEALVKEGAAIGGALPKVKCAKITFSDVALHPLIWICTP
ncbi:MAG: hypothetical protein IKK53_06990 [Ruminiclostridium sp.]|nr:hypothetical protein [Ruminiclostridium sp.]